MNSRSYYSDTIVDFCYKSPPEILTSLITASEFSVEESQIYAWKVQIEILQNICGRYKGAIFFEYSIPRMGRRIDVVLITGPLIFVIEFKVGEARFTQYAKEQVWDYALDLKNFHEPSHKPVLIPILVATDALASAPIIAFTSHNDNLSLPVNCNRDTLKASIDYALATISGTAIDPEDWVQGRYHPTPNIVEAALALYNGHNVEEISRNDAAAINLSITSQTISEIIAQSQENGDKSICFVTGVPGAGKTLVGLNIANKYIEKESELYSVFLSGNGPLVAVLREALARDQVQRERQCGKSVTKGQVLSRVKLFIQNVHNFRDECLVDINKPPLEHVAIFDEAQRAWTLEMTADFMKRKKGRPNFDQSEPEFLISCIDRHPDWGVIVCLVGGGQEINRGEAGISEWLHALKKSFQSWKVYISPHLVDSEYSAARTIDSMVSQNNLVLKRELHLSVSLRSFRAEHVSLFVKQILDIEVDQARQTLQSIKGKYPIVLTRDLKKAKDWMRSRARGSERYGIVVSSQAYRLKPYAIDVKTPMNPVNWFLDGKDDIRSSYFLEDVATEFHVQGLELDWACITWDADFRYSGRHWDQNSFIGTNWNKIRKPERKLYQKNAYRVLLTRARQGMVIVIPQGDSDDHTRQPQFYDPTYEYLRGLGLEEL